MLTLIKVEEVKKLLDEGKLSQRKIAAKLGVSRGTVGAIASGKRGIFGREPDRQDTILSCPDLPPERCPRCGGMVYMPCVLCKARDYRLREKKLQKLQALSFADYRRVA